MKVVLFALCAALLAGCSAVVRLDKTIPLGPPAKFNAAPDVYDHKVVYVRAYMATSPHWWQFFFYGTRHGDRDEDCLSFEENEWIMQNRAQLNNEFIIAKGTFIKGATLNSIVGNCANGNGFVIDEEFMRKRYGKHYQQ